MAEKILTRDEILEADDIQMERVSTPEWGGDVFVKGMSGTKRDAFEKSLLEQKGKTFSANTENIRAKLCSQTICNEAGKLTFTTADAKKLGQKSAAPLSRCYNVAQRLSGVTKDDVEEMAEAMEASPSDGSASG